MLIVDDMESTVRNDDFQAGLLFQGQDVGGPRPVDSRLQGIKPVGVRKAPAQHEEHYMCAFFSPA